MAHNHAWSCRGRPCRVRWPTYLQLREQAYEAVKVIFEQDEKLVELIRRVDASVVKRPRRRPRKVAAALVGIPATKNGRYRESCGALGRA